MNIPLASIGAGVAHGIHQLAAYLPNRTTSQITSTAPSISPLLVAVAPKENFSVAPGKVAKQKIAGVNQASLPAPQMHTEADNRLPSPAERLHLTGVSLGKAERCLARAIYFEARAEPVLGQNAVAQVILNRVFSGYYPNDICDVVYQNADRHLECQFTFACDGRLNVIKERGAWARAGRIAARTLAGDLYDPVVGTSTHYHAIYVRPDWVHEMRKVARYGVHNFYRPVAWGNGAGEPVWGPATMAQNKREAK
jgi:spore germination cell wall hydrolase CwlJ-like protein